MYLLAAKLGLTARILHECTNKLLGGVIVMNWDITEESKNWEYSGRTSLEAVDSCLIRDEFAVRKCNFYLIATN